MEISSKGTTAAGVRLALLVAAALGALFILEGNLFAASPSDGPGRLAALLSANAAKISRMKAGLAAGESRPEWTRLRAEIDAAAHQRDAAWSGLYWHTSLPEALAAATREDKPVLSLRLLGRLDEELSCANSRFFRTALYANTAVSDELRKNWVLHWESVRPAPKVTIDFGDGRTLLRTVTGNSLHYVLDADGKALDVIPGLWEPGEFLRRLGGAVTAAPQGATNGLDENSRLLMRAKAPRLSAAAFARLVAAFERTLADDTRRNADLRKTILPWLAGAPGLPALTERIYRDAFLTPRSDPWLGLVAPDAYSAIEGDPAPAPGGTNALRPARSRPRRSPSSVRSSRTSRPPSAVHRRDEAQAVEREPRGHDREDLRLFRDELRVAARRDDLRLRPELGAETGDHALDESDVPEEEARLHRVLGVAADRRRAARAWSASAAMPIPGAIAPPRYSPFAESAPNVVPVPKSTMQEGPPYISLTATALTMRSAPTAFGSS